MLRSQHSGLGCCISLGGHNLRLETRKTIRWQGQARVIYGGVAQEQSTGLIIPGSVVQFHPPQYQGVAQLVEFRVWNPVVAGSTPASLTT